MQNVIGTLVHPIRIETPFAVGAVYCYLIKDDKTVLVDCGQLEDRSLGKVRQSLEKEGLQIGDIDEIWLTHGHPDHFGQAARLSEMSSARVLGHAKEKANFACNDDRNLFAEFFTQYGIPGKLQNEMLSQLEWLNQFQQHLEPEWVSEGDRLTSGSMNFYVKHTPGHAPGHVMFRGDNGVIFGGDVLLEHISTNALINFDPETGKRNKSLLQYRRSLEWVREQEGIILPGHGKQIEEIRKVADHHLGEHEKRYHSILELLSSSEYTLFELALETFPDAMKQGGVFLVLSEIMGYLDWGLEENKVEQLDEHGQVRFRSSQ